MRIMRFAEVGAGIDTLLIAGGMTAIRHSGNAALLRWIRRQCALGAPPRLGL